MGAPCSAGPADDGGFRPNPTNGERGRGGGAGLREMPSYESPTENSKVPVFRPEAEDYIGILLGQEQYEQEIRKEAGTWFFSRGWAEMGMDFIFHELQVNRLAEKGLDPLKIAHRMLKFYPRAVY